jgi:hypothetical protein
MHFGKKSERSKKDKEKKSPPASKSRNNHARRMAAVVVIRFHWKYQDEAFMFRCLLKNVVARIAVNGS